MLKWRGKNAVVTGASAGIGAAIVRDLANAGINVVALARRVEKLELLEVELKNATGRVFPVACDVSNKESVETAFKKIEKIFGKIHIFVNNAGIIRNVEIFDNEDDLKAMEKIEQVIQTNFTGLVHCTRKAFRLIEKSDDYGIIINIGSTLGHTVPAVDFKFNVYAGTKHAVRATTEVLRMELTRKNNKKIRVSEISPGAVDTEVFEAGYGIPREMMPKTPDISVLSDSDVAQAVIFLLTTPTTVNITELVIRPSCDKF